MEGQWNANDKELAEIKSIAEGDIDTPILMININKYNDDESPSGETYRVYMKISPQILDKAETASRVKQRIHQVMEWSCAQGLRAGNPVDGVKHLLPKQPSAAVRV